MSVVVEESGSYRLITKGALKQVLSVCTSARPDNADHALDEATLAQIQQRFSDWSGQGFRVLGVAEKVVAVKGSKAYAVSDESELSFLGFLLFFDPPKADAAQTIEDLKNMGVQLRIITGDNALVAKHTGCAVGLCVDNILTGAELQSMDDATAQKAIEAGLAVCRDGPEPEGAHHSRAQEESARGRLHGRWHQRCARAACRGCEHLREYGCGYRQGSRRFRAAGKEPQRAQARYRAGSRGPSPTRSSTSISRRAQTSGTCSAWRAASLFMSFLPLLPKQILPDQLHDGFSGDDHRERCCRTRRPSPRRAAGTSSA